jgi:hypothetical protein
VDVKHVKFGPEESGLLLLLDLYPAFTVYLFNFGGGCVTVGLRLSDRKVSTSFDIIV